ncbi:hypothetical protein [Stenotrophomonas indicatrix]|jgi:putative restriction endonuclease|uniref:hypothetical protein n=1 Tax=Stenotrophomonas indicatrix TaxID=2045451 RepID=UPI0028A670E9|nr:hypothetical protein [Stenotrophomonas indicatrix]
MSRLTSAELFALVHHAVSAYGMVSNVLSNQKPYRFEVQAPTGERLVLKVYIWNCTHGGGAARADDEYRIQVTGVVPYNSAGEVTLLLGWHEDHGVFVAWDMFHHEGQDSNSPSTQVREDVLIDAAKNGVAVGLRGNGEYVVAFRPEHLWTYISNMNPLHRGR